MTPGGQGFTLWRISNHDDLEGLGGERTSGRWHTAERAKRIVYLSANPATALLEVLANLKGDPSLFPSFYQLMKVEGTDVASRNVVAEQDLGRDWMEDVNTTRRIGDAWLAESTSALLAVPSVPAPESTNYLLNPKHAEARVLRIASVRRIVFDRRLFHVTERG